MSEEDLDKLYRKLEEGYDKCTLIRHGRPYEYEANHFELVRTMVAYIIEKDRKGEEEDEKDGLFSMD